MVTPEPLRDDIKKFQQESIDENIDYSVLQQEKTHLENKLLQRKYFNKQLQYLYAQLDKARNYEEFVDVLTKNTSVLKEIFTLEGQHRRVELNSSTVEIDWQKYGLGDLTQYIMKDAELLALYNDGLLL